MIPHISHSIRIPGLDTLRWIGVWLPGIALAGLYTLAEGLIHSLGLEESVDVTVDVITLGAMVIGAYYCSTYAARVIRRKQEEEVLRKHQELASLERRFRVLNENSSDGVVLLSAEGTVLYASPSTSGVIGYAPEELLGRGGFEFVHSDDRETATARFAESRLSPERTIRTEFRVRHKDGSWRWIEAVISNLLADPTARAIVQNCRDITERKENEEALRRARDELEARVRERTEELLRTNAALQESLAEGRRAEEALRQSQAQLAGIIGSAMEAIITIAEDQRIVVFNAAAEQMFRVSAAEAIGQPVHRYIPERSLPAHQAGFREFARMNIEKWWIGVLGEATALRADGEEFPIDAAISQVEIGGRKLYTIILHDITERKRAETALRDSREQLRALASRLLSVREDERTRIAREIHDDLGQVLTGLKIDSAWLAARLPVNQPALQQKMRGMLALADSAIHSVRRIATELRPGILDDLGLVAAIEWQAQEFQNRTGIFCEFAPGQTDLSLAPAVGTAAFRICQEALTNVVRHAHATRVSIWLRQEADSLILTVTDNGRGITEQEIANRNSLGLLGMRERALWLGGQVSIVGRPAEGTTVSVQIPVRQVISE